MAWQGKKKKETVTVSQVDWWAHLQAINCWMIKCAFFFGDENIEQNRILSFLAPFTHFSDTLCLWLNAHDPIRKAGLCNLQLSFLFFIKQRFMSNLSKWKLKALNLLSYINVKISLVEKLRKGV